MSEIERIDENHSWEGGHNTHLNCTEVRPWSVYRFREKDKERVNYCPNCAAPLKEGTSQNQEPERKPCGSLHPLPCGLDKECEVPVEYFDAELDSEEIWESYEEDK